MAVCTEEAAFRRAVWKNPDDDVLKLVYADFLQERGETEREAFVRALAGCRWVEVPRVLLAPRRELVAELYAMGEESSVLEAMPDDELRAMMLALTPEPRRKAAGGDHRLLLAGDLNPADGVYLRGLAVVRHYPHRSGATWYYRVGPNAGGRIRDEYTVGLAEAKARAWEYLISFGGTETLPLSELAPHLEAAR
jgi:uncharacterized protein (TIGR02996 family)